MAFLVCKTRANAFGSNGFCEQFWKMPGFLELLRQGLLIAWERHWSESLHPPGANRPSGWSESLQPPSFDEGAGAGLSAVRIGKGTG
jgi:hypothetical protein